MMPFRNFPCSSPLPLPMIIRRHAWFADPMLYPEVKTHALHMKLPHGWWVIASFSKLEVRTYPLGLTACLATFYKILTPLNFGTQDDFPTVALIQYSWMLPVLLPIALAFCCRLWLVDWLNRRSWSWLNINTRIFNDPSFNIKGIWRRFEGG